MWLKGKINTYFRFDMFPRQYYFFAACCQVCNIARVVARTDFNLLQPDNFFFFEVDSSFVLQMLLRMSGLNWLLDAIMWGGLLYHHGVRKMFSECLLSVLLPPSLSATSLCLATIFLSLPRHFSLCLSVSRDSPYYLAVFQGGCHIRSISWPIRKLADGHFYFLKLR